MKLALAHDRERAGILAVNLGRDHHVAASVGALQRQPSDLDVALLAEARPDLLRLVSDGLDTFVLEDDLVVLEPLVGQCGRSRRRLCRFPRLRRIGECSQASSNLAPRLVEVADQIVCRRLKSSKRRASRLHLCGQMFGQGEWVGGRRGPYLPSTGRGLGKPDYLSGQVGTEHPGYGADQ
jgi:hypothetical protein